jgi:hypothetical protein
MAKRDLATDVAALRTELEQLAKLLAPQIRQGKERAQLAINQARRRVEAERAADERAAHLRAVAEARPRVRVSLGEGVGRIEVEPWKDPATEMLSRFVLDKKSGPLFSVEDEPAWDRRLAACADLRALWAAGRIVVEPLTLDERIALESRGA